MKNLSIAAVAIIFMASCQAPTPPAAEEAASAPERYTTDAPEIDMAKAGMQAYLDGDWEALRATFADDAEVYHNTNEPVGPDESIEDMKESLEAVSSYSISEEQYWERIIDDDGETWVYFWGTWHADHAASDKVFEVPIHLAWLYQDGKVAEEYGLWDNSQMVLAQMEAEAQE